MQKKFSIQFEDDELSEMIEAIETIIVEDRIIDQNGVYGEDYAADHIILLFEQFLKKKEIKIKHEIIEKLEKAIDQYIL